MQNFLKEARETIIFCIIIFLFVFAVAYIKKPFTCSANINKVETILQELPMFDDTLKLSKPKKVKSESGILYCITSATKKSGDTIKIPYVVKKEGRQIRVYIDTDYLYEDMLFKAFGDIF